MKSLIEEYCSETDRNIRLLTDLCCAKNSTKKSIQAQFKVCLNMLYVMREHGDMVSPLHRGTLTAGLLKEAVGTGRSLSMLLSNHCDVYNTKAWDIT